MRALVLILSVGAAFLPFASLADVAYVPDEAMGKPRRGSIVIESDGEFLDGASGVVRGTGIEGDPYVIRGWAVFLDRAVGIRIANTTAHVRVEDVVVPSAGVAAYNAGCRAVAPLPDDPRPGCAVEGVVIENASNVTLANVSVGGLLVFGVRLVDSQDVTLVDVDVGRPGLARDEGTTFGVSIARSSRVDLEGLRVWATAPLLLTDARDVRVAGSSLNAFSATGALPALASPAIAHWLRLANVTVEESVFDRASVDLRAAALDVRFVGNLFAGASLRSNPDGDAEVGRLHVCGNAFEGMRGRPALHLERVAESVVRGNHFVGNGIGFRLFPPSRDVAFEGNRIEGSHERGAVFQPSLTPIAETVRAHGNAFVDNAEGITASYGVNATQNWWGHPTGPDLEGDGPGERLHATSDVPYAPWRLEDPGLAPC